MKRISRRNFLKVAGVGAAALVWQPVAAASPVSPQPPVLLPPLLVLPPAIVNTAGFTVQYGPNPRLWILFEQRC